MLFSMVQFKGARILWQTNTREHGYNSFFCYIKRASVEGWRESFHLKLEKGRMKINKRKE